MAQLPHITFLLSKKNNPQIFEVPSGLLFDARLSTILFIVGESVCFSLSCGTKTGIWLKTFQIRAFMRY